MQPPFWKPAITIQAVEVQVSQAISDVLSEDTVAQLVGNAESARQARGIEIRLDQMYMIRFMVPPSDRKIVVMFIWLDDAVRGMVAYYDEVEHMLKKAGTDYRKLAGHPFQSWEKHSFE